MTQNKPEIISARQAKQRGVFPGRAIDTLIREGKIKVIKVGRTNYINWTLLCSELSNGEGDIWK